METILLFLDTQTESQINKNERATSTPRSKSNTKKPTRIKLSTSSSDENHHEKGNNTSSGKNKGEQLNPKVTIFKYFSRFKRL